ncbi:MAG: glycosyltransferase family 2 protein [Cytophagales bacterium]|nr:glycosyltransferase family 2 protein [Cytophagales bacterium]
MIFHLWEIDKYPSNMIITLIQYGFWFVFCLFAVNALYAFIFAVASKFGKSDLQIVPNTNLRTAVFIPAYQENTVIRQTAAAAAKEDYPSDKFDVVVIADGLEPDTIQFLLAIPVKVIEVKFEVSTKAKSLQIALDQLQGQYDTCIVLDVDNVMSKGFIAKVNQTIAQGFLAVQGHRTAKNTNTKLAVLDAVSEEINNSIYRLGHRALGFSSALIGSAMGFNYSVYHRIMAGIHSVGEDKELELLLLRENIKIAYLEDAYVYDEKTQHMGAFKKQRRRWLHSQWHVFKTYFISGWKQLFLNGNLDYFDKSFQSSLIPRVLLLGFLPTFTILSLILPTPTTFFCFLGLFVFYIISLILAIPSRFFNKELLNAVLYLPTVFVNMFLLQFKLKGAGKNFGHTEHTILENA